MKRKLILAGIVALIVLIAGILIASRDAWRQNTRSDYSQMELSADGKLTFQPPKRPQMTFVVESFKPQSRPDHVELPLPTNTTKDPVR